MLALSLGCLASRRCAAALRDPVAKAHLMEAQPAQEPPLSGPIVGALQSQRDINVATQQTIYNFSSVLGEITEEAERRTRRSEFFSALRSVDGEIHDFAPQRIAALHARVVERRLLILHPQADVPSAALARQVARATHKGLEAAPGALFEFTGLPLGIQRFDLVDAIERFADPSVFLVLDASRQVLGWDLSRLLMALERYGQCLIAVADAPKPTWHLGQAEGRFWQEVDTAGLFNAIGLRQTFDELLRTEGHLLPTGLKHEWTTQSTLGGLSGAELRSRLHTPVTIRAFFQALPALAGQVSTETIGVVIEQVRRQPLKGALGSWFHERLSRHDQLIALGTALFSGLREDLFFIHLQRLLVEAWGLRELDGRLLDRADLKPAQAFFTANVSRPTRVQIESRYPELRRVLLELVAQDFSRHLSQAAVWMVDFLRQSVLPGVSQREGLEQQTQRSSVRRAIDEALSDLGRLRLDLVEQPLLALVGDQRGELPIHVARIVARWHAQGDTARVADLLQRWATEREPVEAVRAWLKRDGDAAKSDPGDALRACRLLICTYAARLDPPGKLAPILLTQLETLTDEAGPRLRRAWREYGLPMLVPLHLQALAVTLGRLTRADELRAELVKQLLALYATRYQQVGALVGDWIELAESAVPHQAGAPLASADTILIAIAELLRQLPPDEVCGIAQPELAAAILDRIARQPRHSAVYEAVMVARIRRSYLNEALLLGLPATLQPGDEQRTVELLAELYLDERAAQPEGDAALAWAGRVIPVRLSGGRPLTTVERAIQSWLLRSQNAGAARLALLVGLEQVHALGQREAQFVREQLKAAAAMPPLALPLAMPAQPPSPLSSEPPAAVEPRSFFCDDVVPTLLTLDAPGLRPVIAALLPVARQLQQSSPDDLSFLLQVTWRTQGAKLAQVATLLEAALVLCAQGWFGLRFAQYPNVFRALFVLARQDGALPMLAVFAAGAAVVALLVILVIGLVVR